MATATEFVESWKAKHPTSALIDVKFYFTGYPVKCEELWSQAIEAVETAGAERGFEDWPVYPHSIPLTKISSQNR